MSSYTDQFIAHLQALAQRDRGALAALRRSLGFAPGTYPPAFPSVERFAAQTDDRPSLRQALYLTAGLHAMHPLHMPGRGLAAALARVMTQRDSPSIEKRFVALLAAEPEELPDHLRQVVSLLAADGVGIDYGELLDDLTTWLSPRAYEARDRLRQRWARAFYRAAVPQIEASEAPAAAPNED